MLPKNSRRPLTLDHKIRLKKQRAKAFKDAGLTQETEGETSSNSGNTKPTRRPHQNFKPNPETKIIKQRQSEQDSRDKIREEKDLFFKGLAEEREKSISRRREQNKKLSTKNRRGQPNLNNQIEHLIGKLTGNNNNK